MSGLLNISFLFFLLGWIFIRLLGRNFFRVLRFPHSPYDVLGIPFSEAPASTRDRHKISGAADHTAQITEGCRSFNRVANRLAAKQRGGYFLQRSSLFFPTLQKFFGRCGLRHPEKITRDN